MSTFQSYLIIGRGDKKREKTRKLAKSAGINFDKVSPDIFIISPVKKTIGIDQIRELKSHIFQKPVKDKFKFVVIEQAEKLTTEAQNALLKIYEEPPGHAIVILEAKNKSRIIPTIQSRAVIIQTYDDQFQEDDINLLDQNDIADTLTKITKIEDPADWLDNQIILLFNQLKQVIRTHPSSIRANPHHSSVLIRTIIEMCADTKEMIDSNVNPKFALINLIFSIHFNNSN